MVSGRSADQRTNQALNFARVIVDFNRRLPV